MTIPHESPSENPRPYRILLAVGDDEQHALGQARYVASLPNNARTIEVTLTHVLHDSELDTERNLKTAQRVHSVQMAKEWLDDHGITVEIRDVDHPFPPTKGLVALAEKIDADAIVLSGRKRGLIESMLFGNVAQSVARHTTRPVVIVDPATALTDESPESESVPHAP